MEICTLTRTPGTTLRSSTPAAFVAASPRRHAAAFGWRGRGTTCVTAVPPHAQALQGGAIAELGMAPVTDQTVADHQVIDHTYSTRLGPPSCSPPV